jgi:hypothetical protein
VKASGIDFDTLCRLAGLPQPVPELRFHPVRKWRFDHAWPDHKLALEVQGGIFVSGRHSRGAALMKEHEKLNAAASLGWRVCFVTPKQIANGEAINIVSQALSCLKPVDPVREG